MLTPPLSVAVRAPPGMASYKNVIDALWGELWRAKEILRGRVAELPV